MMRRVFVSLLLTVPMLLFGQEQPKVAACSSCHKDFASVLPKSHAAVPIGGLSRCLACHKSGQPAANDRFAVRMHLAHEGAKQKLDCSLCHNQANGISFALPKGGAPKPEDMALIKEKMNSWSNSPFLDAMHAKAGVDCAGCHGKETPLADSTVENDRCLSCHGPIEKLAERSANKEFPKRNPHASHYGSDIACTTCHHAHEASVVMCAECHKLWKLNIPGAAN
jgi:hypothetical protein